MFHGLYQAIREIPGLGTQRAKGQLIVQNTIHAVQSCGKIYLVRSFLTIVTADHKREVLWQTSAAWFFRSASWG